MIYDFEIVRSHTFDDKKIFRFRFKRNGHEDAFESQFRYYFPNHAIHFSQFYSHKSQIGEFSDKTLEKIVEITLSLPEFRLRHVVSPYNLVF